MKTNKVKVNEDNILNAFKELIEDIMPEKDFYTKDLCMMYGIKLEGQEVEQIKITEDGDIMFYGVNGENMRSSHFKFEGLKDFYNDIVDAWNDEEEFVYMENYGEGRGEW